MDRQLIMYHHLRAHVLCGSEGMETTWNDTIWFDRVRWKRLLYDRVYSPLLIIVALSQVNQLPLIGDVEDLHMSENGQYVLTAVTRKKVSHGTAGH